jgi:hypothetical protein
MNVLLLLVPLILCDAVPPTAQAPDLLLHHARIVTVDGQFRIAEAMAVRGERIVAVGTNDEVLRLAGPKTEKIDLKGQTVLPGLIDSHAHPPWAAVYEFDHPVPDMETIADVLAYIRSRAKALQPGQWITVEQVFITRLRDQRFPTRQELDEAAPNHPVLFRTGPDAALNSPALKRSGIDKDFKVADGQAGYIERDPATGEPTGILRNCTRFVKVVSPERKPTDADRDACMKALLAAYNEVGLTGVTDRATTDESMPRCRSRRSRTPSCGPSAIRCTSTTTSSGSRVLRSFSTAACSPAARTCASRGA